MPTVRVVGKSSTFLNHYFTQTGKGVDVFGAEPLQPFHRTQLIPSELGIDTPLIHSATMHQCKYQKGGDHG